jgi:hypothetical protein
MNEVYIYVAVLAGVVASGLAAVWLLVTAFTPRVGRQPDGAGPEPVEASAMPDLAARVSDVLAWRAQLRLLPADCDPALRAGLERALAQACLSSDASDAARYYEGLDAAETAARRFAGLGLPTEAARLHRLAAQLCLRLYLLEAEPSHLERARRAVSAARILYPAESLSEDWARDEAIGRSFQDHETSANTHPSTDMRPHARAAE